MGPMREPRYKRLPPRVFEPEHRWGCVLVLLLNLLIWAPYIFAFFWILHACTDGPFSERRPLLAPPDEPPGLFVPGDSH